MRRRTVAVASVNPLLRRAETITEPEPSVQHWRSNDRLIIIMVHGNGSPAPDMKKIIPVVGCVAARAAARPVEPQPPRQAGVLLSPIHLSMPTSRGDAKSTADAAKLLIH